MPSPTISAGQHARAALARTSVRHQQVPFITSNRPSCGRFIADAQWIGVARPQAPLGDLTDQATESAS
jgi:hypothetical protein